MRGRGSRSERAKSLRAPACPAPSPSPPTWPVRQRRVSANKPNFLGFRVLVLHSGMRLAFRAVKVSAPHVAVSTLAGGGGDAGDAGEARRFTACQEQRDAHTKCQRSTCAGGCRVSSPGSRAGWQRGVPWPKQVACDAGDALRAICSLAAACHGCPVHDDILEDAAP